MSKALRTAAIVVGAVALIATGVGIAGSAGLLGSGIGAAKATVIAFEVAKYASFAAAGLSFAAQVTAQKPQFDVPSSGTEWRADPYAGLPYAMGETAVGGQIVYRRTDDAWAGGDENDLQTIVSVLSCAGPVQSIDGVDIERAATSFNATTGAASGALSGYVWWKGQLGATPESAQLNIAAGTSSAPSGWTSAHKLSGLAADMVRLRYDSKGDRFGLGEPAKRVRGKWVKVYDPRADSTYPGGSGSCRPFNESTYVWSRNPHLHALTWAMGRYANSKLICGLGFTLGNILVDEFIEGANLCDAYGWHCDGVIFTRPQSAWNNLKLILASAAAVPYQVGGRLGCRNQLPRVAVGSIGAGDLRGEASRPATRPRRERRNIAFYRYRSVANEYDVVDAGAPVRIADYVTADGGEERPTTVELPLVQDIDQAAVVAGYEIAETREAEPLTYVVGPRFFAFKPGDCLTDDTPEGGGLLIRIEKRTIDPEANTVTLICRSETTSKHARVLALAGLAPAVITPPTVPPAPSAPSAGAFTATGTALTDTGGAIPALVIAGAADNAAATEILFWYRPTTGDGVWRAAGSAAPTTTRHEITAVTPGTQYDVGISYRVRGLLGARRVLGPITAGDPVMVWDYVSGANRPADNATRNDDGGGNLIAAPRDVATWILFGGATQPGTTLETTMGGLVAQMSANNDGVIWHSDIVGVTASEELFIRHQVTCDASVPAGVFVVCGANFFDTAGTLLSGAGAAVNATGTEVTQAEANGVVVRKEGRLTVPAGAAFARFYTIRIGGGGGAFYANQPRAGRDRLGADQTRVVTAELAQGNWASGRDYRRGDLAFDANATWTAQTDHTSASGNRPGMDATWAVFSASAAPGVVGSSGSAPVSVFVNSTSYGSAAATVTITAGAGTVVDLNANIDAFFDLGNSGGGCRLAGKWQRDVGGGSWSDVGSEAQTITVAPTPDFPFTYSLFVGAQATGLTSGTAYTFRLLLRVDGGPGTDGIAATGLAQGAGR